MLNLERYDNGNKPIIEMHDTSPPIIYVNSDIVPLNVYTIYV